MQTGRGRVMAGVLAVSVVLAGGMVVGAAPEPVYAARYFANCTKLNKVYHHGVGKPGAHDHVSGHTRKVTNFYKNKALYNANSGKDRDHDGIACEKL